MIRSKKIFALLIASIFLLVLLTACATATPQVITKEVQVQVEVTKEVQVEVTAAPGPFASR